MTNLIALLSCGKGTVAHVAKVIEGQEWEHVYLLKTSEFQGEIPKKENVEIITIDTGKMLPEIIQDIKKSLSGKVSITETAVNIISGDGKEHMALLSALLSLGAGIRFVAFTREGVREV